MAIPNRLPPHPTTLKYTHWNSKKAFFTTETGIGKALKKVEALLNTKVGDHLLKLVPLSQSAATALKKKPQSDVELGALERELKAAITEAEDEMKSLRLLQNAANQLWILLANWKKQKAKLPEKSFAVVIAMESDSDDYLMGMNHIIARGGEDLSSAKKALKAVSDALL